MPHTHTGVKLPKVLQFVPSTQNTKRSSDNIFVFKPPNDGRMCGAPTRKHDSNNNHHHHVMTTAKTTTTASTSLKPLFSTRIAPSSLQPLSQPSALPYDEPTPTPTPMPTPSMKVHQYMQSHMMDAHLLMVQIARTFLMGFGLVSVIAGIGAPTERLRVQCALAGGACFVSTFYYQRLHALRRLPVAMSYSFESNSVAEVMRYSNWTVAICLLGICAFLLRGPFETATYGPLGLWQWSYETWRVAGPLMSSVGTAIGLAGWHSARAIRHHQLNRQWSMVGAYALMCIVCLSISCFTSLSTASAVLSNTADPPVRTRTEIAFSRSISVLWFIYPLISLIRTLALIIGAGKWENPAQPPPLHLDPRLLNDPYSTAPTTTTTTTTRMIRAVSHALQMFLMVLRGVYLTLVAAPTSKSAVAISNLHASSQHITAYDLQPEDIRTGAHLPLYPQSDLVQAHPYRQEMSDYDDLTRLHIPEMTPLCSQGSDSVIAIVDIFSQAITALGCSILTLNDL